MPRVKVDWRSASKDNYSKFCKKYPEIKVTFNEFLNVIYTYNEGIRNHILETGDKVKLPFGFGEFSINKKRRKKMITIDGKDLIKLPIDWQKSKQRGKIIYNFNYHTEGYFFGWMWFKRTSIIKNSELWYFKPSRITSRILSHYIKTDDKYQHIYKEWKK